MAWSIPRLSRRAFLKTTGYGAAGLTLLSPAAQFVKTAAAGTRPSKRSPTASATSAPRVRVEGRDEVRTVAAFGNDNTVDVDGNAFTPALRTPEVGGGLNFKRKRFLALTRDGGYAESRNKSGATCGSIAL